MVHILAKVQNNRFERDRNVPQAQKESISLLELIHAGRLLLERQDEFRDAKSFGNKVGVIRRVIGQNQTEEGPNTREQILGAIRFSRKLLGERLEDVDSKLEKGKQQEHLIERYLEKLENEIFSRLNFLDPYHESQNGEYEMISSKKTVSLSKNELKRRRANMQRHLRSANVFISNLVDNNLDGTETCQALEEIRLCDDFGKLLTYLLKKDGNGQKGKLNDLRFEALRKISTGILIGQTETKQELDQENRRALSDLVSFMNEHIFSKEKPRNQLFLVTVDEENGAKKVEEIDEKPSSIEENQRVFKLPIRTATVEDENGHERQIEVFMESRIKSVEADAAKILRHGYGPNERHLDQNGMRFVFKSSEDFHDFRRTLMKKINSVVEGNARALFILSERNVNGLNNKISKAIEDGEEIRHIKLMIDAVKAQSAQLEQIIEIAEKGKAIDILESKGSIDGSKKAEGRDENSNLNKLKEQKEKWETHGSNGKKRNFEFQFMLLESYWDASYKDGVGHAEYSIRRMTDLLKIYFPKDIYELLNIEKINARKTEEVRQKNRLAA